ISVSKSTNMSNRLELLDSKDELSDKAKEVFTALFNKFAVNDRMYHEQISKYIVACGVGAHANRSRISDILIKYGIGGKSPKVSVGEREDSVPVTRSSTPPAGDSRVANFDYENDFITVDGFLAFYKEACKLRLTSVWSDLASFGYSEDLRNEKELLEEE